VKAGQIYIQMNNIISIPPIRIPTAQPMPYPWPRPINLDPSCVLALLPGGQNSLRWQDESGKGNHGVVTGASLSSKGKHGPAYHFDEIDDHIIVSNFSYGPYFTVCIWLKLDDNVGSDFQWIFSHGENTTLNSLNIYVREENNATNPNALTIYVRNSFDSVNDFTILDFGLSTDWQLITVTVDSSSSKVYIDRLEKESKVTSDNSFNPATNIYIGEDESLIANRNLGGLIDSVLVFNRVLSAKEILNIYNQGI
jgi:Concanavalin A-like lectin/glucanases superfamily